MRQARLRGEGTSYYHCISRIVDRQFILGDEEREHFVALMRKLEAFHGMRVVTYCVMSNHFHLLIEEPDQQQARVTTKIRDLLPKLTKNKVYPPGRYTIGGNFP